MTTGASRWTYGMTGPGVSRSRRGDTALVSHFPRHATVEVDRPGHVVHRDPGVAAQLVRHMQGR